MKQKENLKVGLVGLDLRSAFNLVSHKRLILRLWDLLANAEKFDSNFNLDERVWITNFTLHWLQDRSTMNEQAPEKLKFTKVVRGVPQGAPYSSLLFIIYFNYSGSDSNRSFFAYADDATIAVWGSTWSEIIESLKTSLIEVNDWCKESEMSLSLEKCWFMSLGGQHFIPKIFSNAKLGIQLTTTAKMLGVKLDKCLKFQPHLNELHHYWKFRMKVVQILMHIGLKFRKALTLLYSIRSKLFFGLYWYIRISETSKEKIDTI